MQSQSRESGARPLRGVARRRRREQQPHGGGRDERRERPEGATLPPAVVTERGEAAKRTAPEGTRALPTAKRGPERSATRNPPKAARSGVARRRRATPTHGGVGAPSGGEGPRGGATCQWHATPETHGPGTEEVAASSVLAKRVRQQARAGVRPRRDGGTADARAGYQSAHASREAEQPFDSRNRAPRARP